MAGLDAEVLTAGHGVPIFGAARIRQALSNTAELLESLEAQTLALMNAGAPLDRVIHEVEVPAHLRDQPYLRPIYDHPQFLVRNIWRFYGGWYDGEPDHLLPAPRAEQAREWIAMAGGLDRVLSRAAELRVAGNLRLACHVIEMAVVAAPVSRAAHELRAEIYAARAALEPSSMRRQAAGRGPVGTASLRARPRTGDPDAPAIHFLRTGERRPGRYREPDAAAHSAGAAWAVPGTGIAIPGRVSIRGATPMALTR